MEDQGPSGWGRTPRVARRVDPVDGKAALVIDADGHNDVGVWGRDITMTPDVATVRQNLDLVVDQGVVIPGLTIGGTGNWGITKDQLQYVPRSGIGIAADQRDVFAVLVR